MSATFIKVLSYTQLDVWHVLKHQTNFKDMVEISSASKRNITKEKLQLFVNNFTIVSWEQPQLGSHILFFIFQKTYSCFPIQNR